eukprot:scpid7052/ scgid32441/ Zinc finger ZZ-type and EF-hand domain-containing protein 1
MGAAASSSRGDSDEEDLDTQESSDGENEVSGIASLELSKLFDSKELRELLAGLKDPSSNTAFNKLGALRKCVHAWLADRSKRNESTVSLWQFCQHVLKQENLLSREECVEFFARFDTDSDGVVPLSVFKTLFAAFWEDLNQLSISVSMLKKSPLMPGFLDAFAESKGMPGEHGKHLLMFLLRNRPKDEMLWAPFTSSLKYTSNLRWSAVEAHLRALQEVGEDTQENELQAGMSSEVLKQGKCFASIDVSSNTSDMQNLINPGTSYWQSQGPVHTHWIKVRLRPDVCVKRLALGVMERDASYMPQNISVFGGSSKMSQGIQLAQHVIPNSFNGEFVVAENLKTYYQYITVRILRCRSDGHDTRVHSVSVSGVRVGPVVAKSSLTDVTGVWLIGMMGNTAMATMHLLPSLRIDLMRQTTVAVDQMPPLSLCTSSKDRPAVLSPALLDELARFVRSLLIDGSGAVSPIGLANLAKFSMARGGIATMLDAAVLLQEHRDVELVGLQSWLRGLDSTMSRLTTSSGCPLQMTVASNNKALTDVKNNNITSLVSMAKACKDVFVTKAPHSTFLFSLDSKKTFFLTSLVTRLPKNNNSTRFAVVFAIKDELNGGEVLESFTEDEWTADNYQGKVEDLKSGKTKPPLGEFLGITEIHESSDTIQLFEGHSLMRHIVVKFFEPMKPASGEELPVLHFTTFNFSGYAASESEIVHPGPSKMEELSPLPTGGAPMPASHVLLRLLVFMAELTQLQMLTQAKRKKPLFDMDNVTVLSWWKLYELLCHSSSSGSDDKESSLNTLCRKLALHVLHRLLPALIRHSKEMAREAAAKAQKDKTSDGKDSSSATVDSSATAAEPSPVAAIMTLMSTVTAEAAKPTPAKVAEGFRTLHDHLADLVDDETTAPDIMVIAERVIVDGAEAFFPDAKARCKHVLERIDELAGDGPCKMSRVLSFESLCRYYSKSDSRSLLGLPDDLEKFEKGPVLEVLSKLLAVAFQKTMTQLSDASDASLTSKRARLTTSISNAQPGSPQRMTHELVSLLCALQRTMVTWVAKHLRVPAYVEAKAAAKKADSGAAADSSADKKDAADKEEKEKNKNALLSVEQLLMEYTQLLTKRSVECIEAALRLSKTKEAVQMLEFSIVGMSFRQLLLLLRFFSSVPGLRSPLLTDLVMVYKAVQRVSNVLPKMFLPLSSSLLQAKAEEVMIRTWEVESPHRYDNNMDVYKTFDCPGSSQYVIDFDSRCETEARYDYLEFTDAHGLSRRFDNSVGNVKWPLNVSFPGGGPLNFRFHSDGSSVEWGYKFKVTAMGRPEVAMPWIYDVHLALAEVLGRLTGGCLKQDNASPLVSAKKKKSQDATDTASGEDSADGDGAAAASSSSPDSSAASESGSSSAPASSAPPSTSPQDKDKEESDILLQRLWSTVFRGGFMQKKLQRSFSGQFSASPTDSRVNEFLRNVADRTEGPALDFLSKCQAKRRSPPVGGEPVNQAVAAVFAALCWHSQCIREQLVTYVEETVPDEFSSEIQQAFMTADSLRRQLVDRRQQLVLQSDDAQLSPEEKAAIDPEEPAKSCRAKALFLLKFAGMSRRRQDPDEGESTKSRPKWLIRSNSWDRVYERVKSEGQLQQMKAFAAESQNAARSPLFRMIVDFVTNSALSDKKVQELLENRRKRAVEISDAYVYAADYLTAIGVQNDELQLASLVYLQNMLQALHPASQHYADSLDGCGLEIETRVRRSYYRLVHRLMSMVREAKASSKRGSRSSMARLAFIKCLLHLLDIHWEDFDYWFIMDISLPEFLISVCKVSFDSQVLPAFESEQIERHRRYKRWFPEASGDYSRWASAREPSDNMQLFISSFSEELSNISVNCDICSDTISPIRYRCLTCRDYDICRSCWTGLGEVKNCPEAGPGEMHTFNEMRWSCDSCRVLINGTRIHCEECDDFDLCLGCHYDGSTPLQHQASHRVSRDCTIVGRELTGDELLDHKDQSGPDVDAARLLTSYVHHHAWNLFASSAISLSQYLQNNAATGQSTGDIDYIAQAGILLRRCVRLLTSCVVDISEATRDAAAAARLAAANASKASAVEEAGKDKADDAAKPKDDSSSSDSANADADSEETADGEQFEKPADEEASEGQTSAAAAAAAPDATGGEGSSSATTDADTAAADSQKESSSSDGASTAGSTDGVAASTSVERSLSADSAAGRRKHAPLTVSFSLPEDAAATAALAASADAEQGAVTFGDKMDVGAEVEVEVAGDSDDVQQQQQEELGDGGGAQVPAEVEGLLLDALSDDSAPGSMSPGRDIMSPLASVLLVPESTSDFASRTPTDEDKKFAMTCCEQILGILGTLLTPERISLWGGTEQGERAEEFEVFLRTELLPALFALASMSALGKFIVQNVALALLGRLLGLLKPELCDESLSIYKSRLAENDKVEDDAVALLDVKEMDVDISSGPGMATIAYLFALGTQRMKNSDLEVAALIVDLLQHTCSTGVWRQPTSIYMSSCLEKLSTMSIKQTVDITALFGISVLTGLPYVHRAGMLCRYIPSNDPVAKKGRNSRKKSPMVSDEEGRQVVVLSYDADKCVMEVVDIETRLKSTVKEDCIVEDISNYAVDTSCFPKLVELLESLLPTAALDGLSSVESAVVLSLVLKAVVNCVQDPTSPTAARAVSTLSKMAGHVQSCMSPSPSATSSCSDVTPSSSQSSVTSTSTTTPTTGSLSADATGDADAGDDSATAGLARSATASSSSDDQQHPGGKKQHGRCLGETVEQRVGMLIERNLISALVQLAGRGTALSTSWTLPHLELLCFSLFEPSLLKDTTTATATETTSKADESTEAKKDDPSASADAPSNEASAATAVSGAEDDTKQTDDAQTSDGGPEDSAEKTDKEQDDKTEHSVAASLEAKKDDDDEASSSTSSPDKKEEEKDKKEEEEDKKKEEDTKEEEKEKKDGSDDDDDSDLEQGENPLDGIAEDGKDTILTVHDAFGTKLSILRAIYEKHNRNCEAMINAVRALFDDDSVNLSASDEIKEMAKRWEPKPKIIKPKTRGDGLTDVGLIPFIPSTEETSTLKAVSEDIEVSNALELLIPSNKGDAENGDLVSKVRRTASKALLKTELAKKPADTAASRTDLLKWQSAVAILHARNLLGEVLAHWPSELKLVTQLFQAGEESSMYSLLELLHDSLPWSTFQKVLCEAVKHVEPCHMSPLCQAACQCMRSCVMQKKTAQSDHKYSNNMNETGQITLDGATSVHVSFDNQCSTEEGCDTLTLSSSRDHTQHQREYSGRGSDVWVDADFPGDTVYWKFRTDSSHTEWGWKMTLTGGGMGRFETGYSLVKSLLDGDEPLLRSLPYPQLCRSLVTVASSQISAFRIKALGLLVSMMRHVDKLCIGKEKGPDLGQLRPLWVLYTESFEKVPLESNTPYLAPEITLALTELFFIVENLVMEWDIADEFIIAMATPEGLHDTLSKGICTVAFIGAAIDMPNKATNIFMAEYAKAFAAAAEARKAAEADASKAGRRRRRNRRRYGDNEENDDDDDDDDD